MSEDIYVQVDPAGIIVGASVVRDGGLKIFEPLPLNHAIYRVTGPVIMFKHISEYHAVGRPKG